MNKFKTLKGQYVDVCKHTLGVLNEHPNVDIHVGTDSQVYGNKVIFVSVIAYRFKNKGVNFIYSKDVFTENMDKFNRLMREGQKSIDVAVWLQSIISVAIQIDLDYNSDAKHYSNKLIPVVAGWAGYLGFAVNVKPDLQVATRAADYCCKNV